jgi:MFS transporter, ACS family, tartrate transporter
MSMMSDGKEPQAAADVAANEALATAVWWKVTPRIVPLLFVLYVVNLLDRNNISFAKLTMFKDLELNDAIFGWGAGFFFYIGYIVFEVPSNLILNRTGARVWIARIMISWGIVSALMMFVKNQWHFFGLRILLGVAEAGFFPGMILYLTYWYPGRTRARAVAFFMIASPVSGLIGNPLSGAIMQFLDNFGGLAGWQWLFLIEAIPAVVLGIVVWLWLTDRPADARWLTPSEKAWLSNLLSQEDRRRPQRHFRQALAKPDVWLLCCVYSTVAVSSNGVGFFLPTILQGLFPDYDKWQLGLLAAVPSLAGVTGMILVGMHSDRTGERRWHVAGSAFLASLSLVAWVSFRSPWLALAALALTYFGFMSMMPTFWALATSFLTGTAAAGGIALINSLGNIGGAGAPPVVGWIKDRTEQFTAAAWFMAVAMLLGSLLVLRARNDASQEPK